MRKLSAQTPHRTLLEIFKAWNTVLRPRLMSSWRKKGLDYMSTQTRYLGVSLYIARMDRVRLIEHADPDRPTCFRKESGTIADLRR
jgi:hypothetical protein